MKNKKTVIFAAVALAALAIAFFSLANAGTIEDIEQRIVAAQKEMAELIPLLDNSGGAPAENAAIKNEIDKINQQADSLTSQWQAISNPPQQNPASAQEQIVRILQQTIEAVKLNFGI